MFPVVCQVVIFDSTFSYFLLYSISHLSRGSCVYFCFLCPVSTTSFSCVPTCFYSHVISWTSSFLVHFWVLSSAFGSETCLQHRATWWPSSSDISLLEQFLHCENVRLQKTLSDMCPENPRLLEVLHTWLRDLVIVTIRPLTASVLNSTPLQSAGFLLQVSSC